MSSDKVRAKPMYMVDVDEESGKQLRETRRSASTKDKSKSSHREGKEPRESREARDPRATPRRTKQSNSDSGYSTGHVAGGSEASSPEAQRAKIAVADKEVKKEHRRSTIGRSTPKKTASPPQRSQEVRSPHKLSGEDPAHYGVAAPTSTTTRPATSMSQPIPMRPRAATSSSNRRPVSYHAAMSAFPSAGYAAPPISNSAFWQQQQQQQHPVVMVPPSYPPPTPSYMQYAAPQTQPTDYFAPRPSSRSLANRFDPPSRSTSAYGARQQMPEPYITYHDDAHMGAADGVALRRTESTSIRVPSGRSRAARDYEVMPPPPRPSIPRRPATETQYLDTGRQAYHATHTRDHGLYDPRERPDRYDDYDHQAAPSVPRSPVHRPGSQPLINRNAVSYDFGMGAERVRIEPGTTGRRGHSYYSRPPSSGAYGGHSRVASDVEAKIREAELHQASAGPAPAPLTADMLRRQQRHAGSNRSTKSSGSRDESDYLKSATTRTTRSVSSPEDENVTIKVTGQARVVVGGAQIECQEGGEIKIERREAGTTRLGSERSGSEYGGHAGRIEDRRSRVDRPSAGAGGGGAGRSRMSSRHGHRRSRDLRSEALANFF